MAWVRNKLTGGIHEVPPRHPALSDGAHEVFEVDPRAPVEPEPEPEPGPERPEGDAEPEPKGKRRK